MEHSMDKEYNGQLGINDHYTTDYYRCIDEGSKDEETFTFLYSLNFFPLFFDCILCEFICIVIIIRSWYGNIKISIERELIDGKE